MAAAYSLQSIWRHYVQNIFSIDAPALTLVADEASMDMINLAVSMTELTVYRVYDVLKLSQCIHSKKDHHRMTVLPLPPVCLGPCGLSQQPFVAYGVPLDFSREPVQPAFADRCDFGMRLWTDALHSSSRMRRRLKPGILL